MSKIEMLNLNGEKVKDIKLNDNVFGIEPNDAVLHNAIVLSMASRRQGTHATKTRDMVSGGGRKPWRQKGTGNARQGSIRAPHWVGGGVVFGPTTEKNYTKKMNRKERRLALKSALAYKAQEKELIVVDSLNVETPKTKEVLNVLESLKANRKTLIVVEELTENLILATRNLENVVLIDADEINTLDVVSADNMIITEAAVKRIEEVLI